MNLYESNILHTYEIAVKIANSFSKLPNGVYHTAIKKDGKDIPTKDLIDKTPDQRWIVTNRFDPRVVKRLKELEAKKYEFCNPTIDTKEVMEMPCISWSGEVMNAICSNCGEDFGAHIGLTCPKGEKQ
jgi:hypothetical protein